jgi:hypothetical protein
MAIHRTIGTPIQRCDKSETEQLYWVCADFGHWLRSGLDR